MISTRLVLAVVLLWSAAEVLAQPKDRPGGKRNKSTTRCNLDKAHEAYQVYKSQPAGQEKQPFSHTCSSIRAKTCTTAKVIALLEQGTPLPDLKKECMR